MSLLDNFFSSNFDKCQYHLKYDGCNIEDVMLYYKRCDKSERIKLKQWVKNQIELGKGLEKYKEIFEHMDEWDYWWADELCIAG